MACVRQAQNLGTTFVFSGSFSSAPRSQRRCGENKTCIVNSLQRPLHGQCMVQRVGSVMQTSRTLLGMKLRVEVVEERPDRIDDQQGFGFSQQVLVRMGHARFVAERIKHVYHGSHCSK